MFLKDKKFFVILIFGVFLFFSFSFCFSSEFLGNKINIKNQCDSSLPSSACGPTSLGMILSAFNIEKTTEEMILEVGTDSNGTSLQNLLSVVKKYLPSSRIISYREVDDLKGLLNNGLLLAHINKGSFYTNKYTGKTFNIRSGHGTVLTHFDNNNDAHIIDPSVGKMLVDNADFFTMSYQGIYVTDVPVSPPQFYTRSNMPDWLFENSSSLYIKDESKYEDYLILEIARTKNTQTGDSACALAGSFCTGVIVSGGDEVSCKTKINSGIAICNESGYYEKFDEDHSQLIAGISWYDDAEYSPYSACKKYSSIYYPHRAWNINGEEIGLGCESMADKMVQGTVLCKSYLSGLEGEICSLENKRENGGRQCAEFAEEEFTEEKNPLIINKKTTEGESYKGIDWCNIIPPKITIDIPDVLDCYPYNKSIEVKWKVDNVTESVKCVSTTTAINSVKGWNVDESPQEGVMKTQTVSVSSPDNDEIKETEIDIGLACSYVDGGDVYNVSSFERVNAKSCGIDLEFSESHTMDECLGSTICSTGEDLTAVWSVYGDAIECTASGAWNGNKNIIGGTQNNIDIKQDEENIKLKCKFDQNTEIEVSSCYMVCTNGCSCTESYGENDVCYNYGDNEFCECDCINNSYEEGSACQKTCDAKKPEVTISAGSNPTFGDESVGVVVNWSSSNTNNCNSSWSYEDIGISGSYTSNIDTSGLYSFSINCNGDGGSTSDFIDIEVFLKPDIDLELNRNFDGSVSLVWSADDALYCSDSEEVGSGSTSGNIYFEKKKIDGGKHSYSVTCYGLGGSTSETVQF